MDKTDIKSYNINRLKEYMLEIDEKPFRAVQIYNWLHKHNAVDFEEMRNLPADFKHKLEEKCFITKLKMMEKLVSSEDETTKFLFEVSNGNIIESVLMKYSYGNSVCISSQAGCRMGCSFCASTVNGLAADLTAAEMLSQVYEIQQDCGERVSRVVLMGSGEPLDNYNNVLEFINIISSPDGLNIGQRHITISTCGIVDKMYELAEKQFQITLAVSLHAPNDDIRKRIMPIAAKYPIEAVLEAAQYYAENTKRRVTYEYAMISGVNDDEECAKELAEKIRGTLCHVNIIPVNSVSENDFTHSPEKTINKFAEILNNNGIEATLRRRLGSDINAACGQLRLKYSRKQK